jgi:hypothetical protein
MTEEKKAGATPVAPAYNSVEWDAYVMSLFDSSELSDGFPKTVGLRRVAELLLGDIISSKPVQVFPTDGNGPGRATVVYEVSFLWKLERTEDKQQIRTYADVADVWMGNSDSLFLGFAVASASTRAEGRALKKALKLKKCSAEELTSTDVAKVVALECEEKISPDQIHLIDAKCKKLDISVFSFINSGVNKYKRIYDISRDTGGKMIQELSRLTNTRSDISPTLKGYEEWQ